jgi:tetratricopeptide (TPR) repeat protein
MAYARGDVRECFELELRSIAAAERFGLESMLHFSRANVLSSYYRLGMWEETLAKVEELLADAPPAGPEASARDMRAWIRVARGDVAGAKEDSDWSLEVARRAGDPQAVYPALGTHAHVLVAAGAHEEARPLVLEILEKLEDSAESIPFAASGEVVDTWLALAGRELVLRVLSAWQRGESRWLAAALAFANEDFGRADELYAQIGAAPDVALVHVRAAETLVDSGRQAEADAHLAEALAFYRSVAATRYIRHAEALLAATA